MDNSFFKDNQNIWGFKIPRKHTENLRIDEYTSDKVQNIIIQAMKEGLEVHHLPRLLSPSGFVLPCIFIASNDCLIHYFKTEEDAMIFAEEMTSGTVHSSHHTTMSLPMNVMI